MKTKQSFISIDANVKIGISILFSLLLYIILR